MAFGRLLVVLALLAAGACASGKGGGSALYRREIGQASGPDARRLAEQVVDRYGYMVDTYEEAPEIRILTHWRPRLPFDDEKSAGVTSAESRLLIVARQRSVNEMGSTYNIIMTVENRLGLAGEPPLNSTLNTPMFRAYADGISNDLRQLVSNIGVRTYR